MCACVYMFNIVYILMVCFNWGLLISLLCYINVSFHEQVEWTEGMEVSLYWYIHVLDWAKVKLVGDR